MENNKENVHLLSFICYQDYYAALRDLGEKAVEWPGTWIHPSNSSEMQIFTKWTLHNQKRGSSPCICAEKPGSMYDTVKDTKDNARHNPCFTFFFLF